jgi:hypothetical protein
VRTSEKNTSLNSLVPVSCTMGRTSMPGLSILTRRNEMPRCFGASRSVRANTKHQSLHAASDVHTFCPLSTHWAPSGPSARSPRVDRLARSLPASGSL